MEIKIEKGVDLPPRGKKALFLTKEMKSSLLSMNVGDSFVVKKITNVIRIQMWGIQKHKHNQKQPIKHLR